MWHCIIKLNFHSIVFFIKTVEIVSNVYSRIQLKNHDFDNRNFYSLEFIYSIRPFEKARLLHDTFSLKADQLLLKQTVLIKEHRTALPKVEYFKWNLKNRWFIYYSIYYTPYILIFHPFLLIIIHYPSSYTFLWISIRIFYNTFPSSSKDFDKKFTKRI